MPPTLPTTDRPWPSSSAPYPTRPLSRSSRQRAISQHDRSPSGPAGSLHNGNLAGRFDYFAVDSSPLEGLKRGTTASSDGSFSSYGSQLTSTTAATSLLSESPDTIPPHLQRHMKSKQADPLDILPLPHGYPLEKTAIYHENTQRRPTRSRKSSSASYNLARRAAQLDADDSRYDILPPPTLAQLQPLQLESDRTRELEREQPLTLPPPWLAHPASRYAQDGITGTALRQSAATSSRAVAEAASRARAGSLGVSMQRTRSRSPDVSSRTARIPNAMPSSIPQDLPKEKFVEGLIGAACTAIEVVWKNGRSSSASTSTQFNHGLPTPAVSPVSRTSPTSNLESVLPLRQFIREVLRRSRSTCSTLQTALYYIHKSRDAIREKVRAANEATLELQRIKEYGRQDDEFGLLSAGTEIGADLTAERVSELLQTTRSQILCGRRMFLAALICASKFLQDRNYCNRAWARITSLPVQEINANEKAFLETMDYNLFIDADLFKNWTRRLQDLAQQQEKKAASMSSLVSGISTSQGGNYLTLPRPQLPPINTSVREGLLRTQSEYLPPPELTDVSRAGPPPPIPSIRYPLTPADTPRMRASSVSPERHLRRTPPSRLYSSEGLVRSQTEPRLAETFANRLPPLGSLNVLPSMERNSVTRPVLPRLNIGSALKTHSYAPPSPSPMSGRGRFASAASYEQEYEDETEDCYGKDANLLRTPTYLPRPSLQSFNSNSNRHVTVY